MKHGCRRRDLRRPQRSVLFAGRGRWGAGAPEHEATIQTVLKACLASNMPRAITVDAEDVAHRLQEGFRMVSPDSGGLEAQMDLALRNARAELARRP